MKTKASSSDANASESSATKDPSDDAQTDNGRSSPDKSPSSTDDATSVAGHDQVADASMSAKRTQDLSLSASIERAVAHGHGDFVWDAKGLSMFDISEKMKSQLEGTSQQAGLLPSGLLESKSLATTILTDKARAIIDAGRRNSIGLRRQLQGLVQARSRDQKRMTQSGHRVNPRRISRLSVWNPRVFTRLQLHESTATAVHLLLDMSGSMRGERERIAAESAVALFLALTALPHCNPALTIFQGRGHAKAIFRHGETLDDRTKARVSEIDASGGTPLFQALGDILVDLAQTREKRKVIFVITDGDPDDPRETHRLVKAIEASDGIEIVGIGINAETSWLFDRSVRLDEIEKLPDVLFGLAKETALTGIQ